MTNAIDYVLGDALPEPGTAITVADGVRWVRMPLPFALNHVNLYLIEDDDGWVLIDCGLGNDTTKELWQSVLEKHLEGRPITQILVTHYHPDHMGSAGWLMERTEANLWMTRSEWLSARAIRLDDTEELLDGIVSFYRHTGLGESDVADMRSLGNSYRRMVAPIPLTFSRLAPDTVLEIGGRRWMVVIGSGHSPEHACLYCPEAGLMIGGDFLLPRISPNISVWWNEPDGNPLQDYLKFLGSLDPIADDTLVLPSHDRPYRGLKHRAVDLAEHHDKRLDLAEQVCRVPSTAIDVMNAMFQRKMDAHQTRFAVGESLAHLNLLIDQGRLSRHLGEDGAWRYVAA